MKGAILFVDGYAIYMYRQFTVVELPFIHHYLSISGVQRNRLWRMIMPNDSLRASMNARYM